MGEAPAAAASLAKKRNVVRISPVAFNTFKWCTYALLCLNGFIFWQEDGSGARFRRTRLGSARLEIRSQIS
jgi:hypothetical protein